MEINDHIDITREDGSYGGDDVIIVTDKKTKEQLLEWHDNAHYDYPEDLTWSRMIGTLFRKAFLIGFRYGMQSKKEDKNEKKT